MTKTENGSSTSVAPGKMAKSESSNRAAKRSKSTKKSPAPKKLAAKAKISANREAKSDDMEPIVVKHQTVIPDGLPKKYFSKSTFNTHDIMHAPVEKTLQMLDKILSGERLFTM